MSPVGRRAALRFAAAAVLVPIASLASAQAPRPVRFAPPAGPMLYTRRLERELAGGAAFVVSRGFEIRFLPDPAGYRVEGRQVEVEVDAPEALSGFARIEREREERGLFPLLLDAGGMIVGGAGTPIASRLDDAVREALAMLDARSYDPADRAELERFVNLFHQTAGTLTTELPRQLFAPPAAPLRERREVALPGGDSGTVVVSFSAARDPATGLMRQARREVVTELEGDRRRTLESWSLAAIS